MDDFAEKLGEISSTFSARGLSINGYNAKAPEIGACKRLVWYWKCNACGKVFPVYSADYAYKIKTRKGEEHYCSYHCLRTVQSVRDKEEMEKRRRDEEKEIAKERAAQKRHYEREKERKKEQQEKRRKKAMKKKIG